MAAYFKIPKIFMLILFSAILQLSTKLSFSIFGVELNGLVFITILSPILILITIVYHQGFISNNNYEVQEIRNNSTVKYFNKILSYRVFLEQQGTLVVFPYFILAIIIQSPAYFSNLIASSSIISFILSFSIAFSLLATYARVTVFDEWMHKEIQSKYSEILTLEKS